MPFLTIHTNYGLQKLAQAESTGTQIRLTHMAVGDGNGNAAPPNPNQTQLVRERFRATINRVYQDANNPLRFTAELVIPASVGGFTMREVGVFDADGSLFAVGDLPSTYKPVDTEGAYSDTVVRLDFMVSNASTITLQVDPNVVVVTQQWISNNVTAGTIIPGGTTGQVLAKQSNADGDVHWVDPTQANVVVDTITEKQTLAANQTVVMLTTTITRGLAVYIEGIRLPQGSGVDEWQPDATDSSKFTLGKPYPDGSILQAVNNEPAGSAHAPLERSKNLSDVASKSESRSNLEVYSKTETDQKMPTGGIVYFPRSTAPTGWLKANGAAISRTAYANLFSVIGTIFGNGDGVNTFNLPDLRGEFIRGYDDGRGVDASRSLGSYQADEIKSHYHRLGSEFVANGAANLIADAWNQGTSGNYPEGIGTGSTGGTETRPRNIALLACIKF
ncbi:tail protein [Escherichia phage vB_EcoM_ECOO78]|uniref:Tail protein n=1 Tax=Escherichia phage vB_EcoM_ECOO78 TaxID=1970797 RepID=A0A1W6JT73_9CAUD|nr:tail protein [Escherichia phage vB_EcoM_ECOO78]ARM70446.1 tail protein [Escherichia phage vB_EcoM_ECOO78]